jgi:DNA-binding response OmpR family regulator
VGALNAGASDYLVKPFIPEELAARISRLIPINRAQ